MSKKKIPDNAEAPESWPEVIAAFEEDLYRRGRSQATIATYGSALRVFGRFSQTELTKPGPYPSRLQETDFRAFLDHLRRDRLLTAQSLNRFIASLRAFSKFLLRKHWHPRDLGLDLRTFRRPRPAQPHRLSRKCGASSAS